MSKNKSKLKISLIIIASAIILIIGGFYIYTLDYYRADDMVAETYSQSTENITIQDGMTIFHPAKANDKKTGLIFYPGGKVENIAYAPILHNLSQYGITCVLVKMPLNLAVFDTKAANDVFGAISNIDSWYLAGHSLGGAMASSYAGDNLDKLDGLILLGAYPINDADVPTLVVYGSEDLGLDLSKLEDVENKFEIVGGNHAYFGNYGEQEGDGTARITRNAQQEIAVDKIIEFIFGE